MTSITIPIYFLNQSPNQIEPFDQAGRKWLVNKTLDVSTPH